MTYPNGPYGQGIPEQPGYQPPAYPQQPGYPGGQQPGYPQHPGYPPHPGYPQPGYPPQPYGLQPPQSASPSGVSGITAGVLAGLGGFANFFGGLLMAFGLAAIMGESTLESSPAVTDGGWTWLVAVVMLNVVCGLLLLIGALMLLLRNIIGRGLVIAGCSVFILSTLINFMLVPSTIGDYEYDRGTGPDLVGLMFAITTLVLALVPSTTAWIQAKRNPVAPQYYPPYPG
ncbi:hypothetical protein [Mycolicibacterium sp. XJ870]